MTDDELRAEKDLAGRLNALRLVIYALAVSNCVLTLVSIFSAGRMAGPPLPDMGVVYGFLGVGVLGVLFNLTVAPAAGRFAARATSEPAAGVPLPFQRFANETITRAALAEVPAVFLIIGYLVTHNLLVLAPIPVLLLLLLLLVPSADKFARIRERQADTPYTSGESADSPDRERP